MQWLVCEAENLILREVSGGLLSSRLSLKGFNIDRVNNRFGMFNRVSSTSGRRDRAGPLYNVLDCDACIGTLRIAKSSLDIMVVR